MAVLIVAAYIVLLVIWLVGFLLLLTAFLIAKDTDGIDIKMSAFFTMGFALMAATTWAVYALPEWS